MMNRSIFQSFGIHFVILFFSTNLIPFLKAQPIFSPGTVVLENGDTLIGLVGELEGTKRFDRCLFKPSYRSAATTFSPDELHSFSIENRRHFKSMEFNADGESRRKVLLEYFVEGEVSLFKFQKDYYLSKGNSEVKKIPFNVDKLSLKENREELGKMRLEWYNFAKDIYDQCSGSDDFFEDFYRLKNKLKKLIEVVKEYNECLRADYVEYGQGIPFNVIDIGPGVSLNRTRLNITSRPNAAHPFGSPFKFLDDNPIRQYGFEWAIPFVLRAVRKPSRWSFFSEPFFKEFRVHYEILEENQLYPEQTYNDLKLEWIEAGITSGARYQLAAFNSRLSVQAGLRYNLRMNQQTSLYKEHLVFRDGLTHITRTSEPSFLLTSQQWGLSSQLNFSDDWAALSGQWQISLGFLIVKEVTEKDLSFFEKGYTANSTSSALFIKTSFLW